MISLFKIISELEINKPGINYQKEWDRIKKEIMDEYGYGEGYFDKVDDEDGGYDDWEEYEINRMVDGEFEKLYPGKLVNLQEDNVTGGTATFNAGYGENYATPFSFGKKRKSKKNKFKSKTFDVISWKEGLNELKINKPGGRKISLQSFKDNMKNWFKTNYGEDLGIDFGELNKGIDSLKYKRDLIDFIKGEDLIGDDWPSLLEFIIDNTINI